MAVTYEQLKQAENKQQIFNEIKSDGYKLLQDGKIDAKTYYAKTSSIPIFLVLA